METKSDSTQPLSTEEKQDLTRGKRSNVLGQITMDGIKEPKAKQEIIKDVIDNSVEANQISEKKEGKEEKTFNPFANSEWDKDFLILHPEVISDNNSVLLRSLGGVLTVDNREKNL